MIRGAHVILYSSDADADREFLRELLGLRSVDAGGGWTIVQLPPAEVAVHPAEASGAVELYLVCDDVEQTVAELKSRGVEFTRPIIDQGFGLITAFRMPGGVEVELYQPRYSKNPRR